MNYAASKQFVSPRGVSAAGGDSTALPWELDGGITAARQETWLLSFIDILALLLTLLVLLLAYQDQDHRMEQELATAATKNDPGSEFSLQALLTANNTRVLIPSALDEVQGFAMPGESLLPPAVESVGVEAVAAPGDAAESAEPESPQAPEQMAPSEVPEPASAENPNEGLAQAVETVGVGPVTATDSPAESAEPVLPPAPAQMVSPEPPVDVSAESRDAEIPPGDEPVDSAAESEPPAVSASSDLPSPVVAAAPLDRVIDALHSSQLQDRIEVVVGSGDVSLEISDSILFAPASAALSETGTELLVAVAELLQTLPYSSLSVEGHTDNVPIQTALYPSNWELSSARAAAVTRALIEVGLSPDRIRAIGYGDTRPRDDNGSESGRARNRRVTFVLQLEGEV